jgi:2-polyprenyl-3-methyl-5-hydroxy-6-metoxy-1,4-benzoquinol methylase
LLAIPNQLQRVQERLDDVERDLRAVPRDPIDEFTFMSYATRRDGLFDGSYDEWRARRVQKLLGIYGGEYFRGKRVLELGAGHGDIGALFASLGAAVTCVDGRPENLEFGRLKHRRVDGLTFELIDLEHDFRSLGSFDLIIHFGLLYHLPNPEEHLKLCFEMCDEMVLESLVCDSRDAQRVVVIEERAEVNEEAVGGRGCRPSPFFIERVATESGFRIERHFTADLNSKEAIYDWEHADDDASDGWWRRRFWRFRHS